jgi:hypothetical protein
MELLDSALGVSGVNRALKREWLATMWYLVMGRRTLIHSVEQDVPVAMMIVLVRNTVSKG